MSELNYRRLQMYGTPRSGYLVYDNDAITTSYGMWYSVAHPTDNNILFTMGHNSDFVRKIQLNNGNLVGSSVIQTSGLINPSGETSPRGIWFSSDGMYMFMIGEVTKFIYKYTLSSSFDLSTLSYSQQSTTPESLGIPRSIYLSNDGLNLYVSVGMYIKQYSMSTPFDLSTLSVVYTTPSLGAAISGMWINASGTRLAYLIGSSTTDRELYFYRLNTPFMLSSRELLKSLNVSSIIPADNSGGCSFSRNGKKLYITRYSKSAYSFDLPVPFNFNKGLKIL